MRYLFKQSQGNDSTVCIVENPKVKEGTVFATKIGNLAGWKGHEEIFEEIPAVGFIASGSWTMTEYKGKLWKSS